jgi:KDO2-lipid IV(A) lauroyltransferase
VTDQTAHLPPLAKRLRYGVEAMAAWLALALLRALSLPAASATAGRVARLIGPRLGVSRRARANLTMVFPELAPAEVEKIVRDMWENIGRVAGELPHLDAFFLARNAQDMSKPGAIEVVGGEYVTDPTLQLAFSGHIGNWELMPVTSRLLGRECHVVYRAANNPAVDRLIDKMRLVTAAGTLPKGAKGARDIIRLLRDGEAIGMLVDQKMNEGIEVPFFGRGAMTAPALAQLALRFKSAPLPARCERLGGPRFRITFEPPIAVPESGDREADIADIMTRVNERLEAWIAERPSQWLWLHRRWPD